MHKRCDRLCFIVLSITTIFITAKSAIVLLYEKKQV